MNPTVVFVHGAFISDSQWWWRPAAAILEAERGIKSVTIDLPSCGDTPPLADLHGDARAVRELLEATEGPIILVGHSYGGAVVSEAAVGLEDKVKQLVFISAVVVDGESIVESDYISDDQRLDPGGHLEVREDGTVSEGAQQYKTRVLSGLPDPEMSEAATSRLTRQSMHCFIQTIEGAAWKTIPSRYIVCQFDADVGQPEQKAQASRTGAVTEVPTNHFAHLERPDLVAEVIFAAADAITADAGSAAVA